MNPQYSYSARVSGQADGQQIVIDLRLEGPLSETRISTQAALMQVLKSACVEAIRQRGGQADLTEL